MVRPSPGMITVGSFMDGRLGAGPGAVNFPSAAPAATGCSSCRCLVVEADKHSGIIDGLAPRDHGIRRKGLVGKPMAMQIMMTWSSGMPACSRTTGDCMIPWLLMTQPSPLDHAAFTSALATAPQSKGATSPPWMDLS